MKGFKWDKRYLYWGVTAFLVISASIIFYFSLFRLEEILGGLDVLINILMPFICGLVIAYLLTPVLNFIEEKLVYRLCERQNWNPSKGKRRAIRYLCVVAALLFGISIIYAIIAMIVPSLVESIISIINNFPHYLDNVELLIQRFVDTHPEFEDIAFLFFDKTSAKIENVLTENVLPQMSNILGQLSAGVFDILGFLWDVILGAIISIYLMADKEGLIAHCKMFMYSFMDTESVNHFLKNLRFVNKTFGGFISGKIVDSIIIGIICYVCTSFIGTPYAVFVSVVIGVTNVIPFFGPFLGAIPMALLILMVSPIQCLYFVIFVFLLQQFDGNFLGPKILGGSTGISSLMVIVAILFFGGLMGVLGMIIGVPVTAVVWAILRTRRDNRLRKKSLSDDAESYKCLDYIDIKSNQPIAYTKESIENQKSYQISPKKLRRDEEMQKKMSAEDNEE